MARSAAGTRRHALSGPERFGVFRIREYDITRHDLIRLADEHDIGNAPATIGRVLDAVSRWMDHATARGIPRTNATLAASQHRLSI